MCLMEIAFLAAGFTAVICGAKSDKAYDAILTGSLFAPSAGFITYKFLNEMMSHSKVLQTLGPLAAGGAISYWTFRLKKLGDGPSKTTRTTGTVEATNSMASKL